MAESTFSLAEKAKDVKDAKEKFFIQYLFDNFGSDGSFDNMFLSLLDEDDFIDSLVKYIKEYAHARTTGSNYISFLRTFFSWLATEYHIENETMINNVKYDQFKRRADEIVSTLPESENKDLASDKDYGNLIIEIDQFIKNHPNMEQEMIDEISKSTTHSRSHKSVYLRFVSIIILKLILTYGLKNITAVSLQVQNLNLTNATLTINGISVKLTDELLRLLNLYMKIREQILTNTSKEQELLFVQADGKTYLQSKSNRNNIIQADTAFIFLKDIFGSVAAEQFSFRRIAYIINNGLGIDTISRITGYPIETCAKIKSESHLEQENEESEIELCFSGKAFMRCPCCGRVKESSSENWVLVQ